MIQITARDRSSFLEQRAFLFSLSPRLGISSDLSLWYKVKGADVKKFGGASFLARHRNSLVKLLAFAFPEHPWDLTQFSHKPRNYWSSHAHQRALLEKAARQLGINEGNYEPWYHVTARTLMRLGGDVILQRYGRSMRKLLMAVFPEHQWDANRFKTKQQSYWTMTENQRNFLINLGSKLGIPSGTFEGWYGVSAAEFVKHGGSGLMAVYNSSPSTAIMSVFPDHEWQSWRFKSRNTSISIWEDDERQKSLAEFIALRLDFRDSDSWYRFSKVHIRSLKLDSIIKDEHHVLRLVQCAYPQVNWDLSRFSSQLSG